MISNHGPSLLWLHLYTTQPSSIWSVSEKEAKVFLIGMFVVFMLGVTHDIFHSLFDQSTHFLQPWPAAIISLSIPSQEHETWDMLRHQRVCVLKCACQGQLAVTTQNSKQMKVLCVCPIFVHVPYFTPILMPSKLFQLHLGWCYLKWEEHTHTHILPIHL